MGKYELDLEKYKKAIEKVLVRFVERGCDKVSFEELWFETSIPVDIIREVFQAGVSIPKEIVEIKDDKGALIWKVEIPQEVPQEEPTEE